MAAKTLSAEDRTRLEELFQKGWDGAIKHDAQYLANMKPSFFDRMLDSPDGTVRQLGQYSRLLQRYLIDWMNGDYEAEWRTIAAFTSALNYIVNPFDLIPDTVPHVGYSDDQYVFELAIGHFQAELDRYVEVMGIDISEFDVIRK